MRNHKYQDDQKVFAFINNPECKYFADLEKFLYENRLPFRARWCFYFLGKINWIGEQAISQMADKSHRSYGGYVFDNIYHWEEYLKDEENQKRYLQLELEEENKEVSFAEFERLFIERGFEHVAYCVNQDYENDLYQLERMAEEDRVRDEYTNFRNYPSDSSICDACHESPCRCSDREDSSTVHDY
ncbi:MAG: hypothetical protein H6561_10405 [Lewinellaceae bacterium]|nr:hypothetical protein [Lewinellaceae bacterium]